MIWLHFTVYIFFTGYGPNPVLLYEKEQLGQSAKYLFTTFLWTFTSNNDIHDTNLLSVSFFNQKKKSFCSVSKNGTKINYIEEWKRKR